MSGVELLERLPGIVAEAQASGDLVELGSAGGGIEHGLRCRLTLGVAALSAAGRGRRWRREDIEAGGDLAQIVRGFQGPLDAVRALNGKATVQRLLNRRASWFQGDEVLIGQDVRDGGLVRIPLGGDTGGTHTLVLGAAGSGKTVTMTGIAVHGVEHGMGAVLVSLTDQACTLRLPLAS